MENHLLLKKIGVSIPYFSFNAFDAFEIFEIFLLIPRELNQSRNFPEKNEKHPKKRTDEYNEYDQLQHMYVLYPKQGIRKSSYFVSGESFYLDILPYLGNRFIHQAFHGF